MQFLICLLRVSHTIEKYVKFFAIIVGLACLMDLDAESGSKSAPDRLFQTRQITGSMN